MNNTITIDCKFAKYLGIIPAVVYAHIERSINEYIWRGDYDLDPYEVRLNVDVDFYDELVCVGEINVDNSLIEMEREGVIEINRKDTISVKLRRDFNINQITERL